MKLISWNVNGLRAVEKKQELSKLIVKNNPELILFQETKMGADDAAELLNKYSLYEQVYHRAQKKGYSGTSVWVDKRIKAKHLLKPEEVTDTEGRIIRTDIGDWTILNIYFPNGGKSPQAWNDKLKFYDEFLSYINKLHNKGRIVLWAGDVNCAHQEIDIARPKENNGKIGFHPKERAWMTRTIHEGWIDIFRDRNPDKVVYSWWHLRSGARARNVGWRIDYAFIHEKHKEKITNVFYDTEQQGSDHCPLIIEAEITY